ncbi:response regulator transcription factor [Secundilactobacillus kimchicus]|uniref:response regulator transcription factor n=1 Tax=Secundilactobacillus kimchicus TaxID=528209 RepID=UPI0024A9C5BA|nr:response regulator transcription factor [Secundilactobacillus kimchicus]
MKLMMIEDNDSVIKMMKMFFEKEQWDVTVAKDGKEALELFEKSPDAWDMITLDLNLPSMDGMQLSGKIRAISDTVPIIMLTARDSESDQILGLEMGADDYVTKPFSPIALMARIKALDRRVKVGQKERQEKAEPVKGTTAESLEVPKEEATDGVITTDHFKLDNNTREAYLNGQLIDDLTPKEFELLRTLAHKPKQVFSREQLLQLVWDFEYYGDERTVDAHIKKLRQKIERVGPQVIQTVWGIGYRFDDSDISDTDAKDPATKNSGADQS